MTGKAEDVTAMCDAHLRFGTTAMLPTALASPAKQMRDAAKAVLEAINSGKCKNAVGVHLEGPFLAKSQCGAQKPDALLNPSDTIADSLLECGIVRMMGMAPELPGALRLGKRLSSEGITVSIAHSGASFEQVDEAIMNGFSDVTHIYSGCSGIYRENGYRIAGVIEAGLYNSCLTAGVIADLKHLPVSLLKLIYKCKGDSDIYLMTDGLEFSASKLTEGTVYTQENGVQTVCEDGVMKLISRQAFAGSVATMNVLVKNMYKAVGIPLPSCVKMATETPALIIGMGDTKGKLKENYDADIVLFDDDIDVKHCICGGELIF